MLFVFVLAPVTIVRADMICEGTLNGVYMDNVRPMYIPAWYANGKVPHYLCEIEKEGTPLCKQRFAIMLTAFSLGKKVWVTYPSSSGNAPCAGNMSSVIPFSVAAINW